MKNILITALAERKILSNISQLINIELQQYSIFDLMPPISIHIVNQTSYWNKLGCFLLAKSLLRFSDAATVNWYDVVASGFFIIKQSKTKKTVLSKFDIYNQTLKKQILTYSKSGLKLNYNSIATEINLIVRRNLSHNNFDFKHKTHIFRHLYASWNAEKGLSKSVTAEALGNSPDTVTQCYIHSNLLLTKF